MFNPIKYSTANYIQINDIKYITKHYYKNLKWLANGGDISLDVGCGDGGVTHEFLLNNMPKSVKMILGVDISPEMVQHATSFHQHPKLEFAELDITTKILPQRFIRKFDHAFSFYCFHWFRNQRQAFHNIYDLLKPNGDLLIAYPAKHPLFEMYKKIAKFKKWAPYMQDNYQHSGPYQNCLETDKVHRLLLERIGFNVELCKCEKRLFLYKNIKSWRDFIEAVNPYIHRIPELNKNEYIDEYMIESEKRGFILENKTVKTPYELLIVYAQKKKIV